MTNESLESRKRFNLRYNVIKNLALCIASQHVESLQLQTLTLKQRVLALLKELQLLKLVADAFMRKDYLIFANNQDCLYNVFSSNYLIYKCDEESLLLDGLVIFEKRKCITRLLAKAKKEFPLFAPADFSQEKENTLLYELHKRL